MFTTASTLFSLRTFLGLLLLSLCASANPVNSGFRVQGPRVLKECTMARFSWRNSISPVYITVIPEGETMESMAEDRVRVRMGDRAAWRVDLPAGNTVWVIRCFLACEAARVPLLIKVWLFHRVSSFALEDATGAIAMIDSMMIRAGTTDCMTDVFDDENADALLPWVALLSRHQNQLR